MSRKIIISARVKFSTKVDYCYFCFDELSAGSYRVSFPAMQERDEFFVTICMAEDGENIFTAPAFFDGVETRKEGRKYIVNVE